MITATWRTQRFSVDASKIYSFHSMSMSTGVELEEKVVGNEAYQEKSSETPAELSIDVQLSSLMGINPRSELESWIRLSRDGVAGRFYVGNRDFLGCTLILTECEAKNIELGPDGELKACSLSLTFEQASARWTSGESAKEEMVGGGGGGKGGGSKIDKIKGKRKSNADKREKEKRRDNVINTLSNISKKSSKKGKEASRVSAVTGKSSKPAATNVLRKTNTVKPRKETKPAAPPVNTIKPRPTKGLTGVFRQTRAIK